MTSMSAAATSYIILNTQLRFPCPYQFLFYFTNTRFSGFGSGCILLFLSALFLVWCVQVFCFCIFGGGMVLSIPSFSSAKLACCGTYNSCLDFQLCPQVPKSWRALIYTPTLGHTRVAVLRLRTGKQGLLVCNSS